MKKINELYGLEWASDCYYIDDNQNIINVNTNSVKAKTIGKRGYYYVTLNRKCDNKQIKVFLHRIIALAFIGNHEYEVINHIDGNKLNNAISNLEFCTQKHNIRHAFKFGLVNRKERLFKIDFFNGQTAIMTAKQAHETFGIPRITLYDMYYKHTSSKKWNIKGVSKYEESVETIESE